VLRNIFCSWTNDWLAKELYSVVTAWVPKSGLRDTISGQLSSIGHSSPKTQKEEFRGLWS
jgi:hypothetical protein